MNKKISALLLAGAMILSLAACGGQGSTPAASSSTPTAGQTTGLTEAFAESPVLVTSGGQSAD